MQLTLLGCQCKHLHVAYICRNLFGRMSFALNPRALNYGRTRHQLVRFATTVSAMWILFAQEFPAIVMVVNTKYNNMCLTTQLKLQIHWAVESKRHQPL